MYGGASAKRDLMRVQNALVQRLTLTLNLGPPIIILRHKLCFKSLSKMVGSKSYISDQKATE